MSSLHRSGLALLLMAAASPAFAHAGHATAGGFVSGLFHPLLGIDHLLAMVAVGIWSVVLGFTLATAILHLVGVAAGLAARGRAGMLAVRASGAATAAVGLGFIASTM